MREVVVQGHRLIEVRTPSQAGRTEVWVAEIAKGRLAELLHTRVGPIDADGETSWEVELTPAGLIEYQTAARLYRCDGEPLRLFPRTFDFSARRMLEAAAPLPPPSSTRIRATRDDAGAPAGRPLGGFHVIGASSQLGVPPSPNALGPPTSAADGDPATAWFEGAAGDGRGETLLARSGRGAVPVTGIRILAGSGRSAADHKAHGRPRLLTIITGRGDEHRLDVELPDDSATPDAHRKPIWIPLPRPQTTACVSVVLREVTPGASAATKAVTAISELDVFTELAGAGEVDHLIASMAHGEGCEALVADLTEVISTSPAAVPAVVAALTRASPAGRGCLTEGLVRLGEPALRALDPESLTTLGAALAAGLRGTDREGERRVALLAGRLPAIVTPPIGALLLDEASDVADRGRAARILGAMASPEAGARLLEAVGRGPAELRQVVRALVAQPRPGALERVAQALAATPAGQPDRRADLVLILGKLAAASHPEHTAVEARDRIRAGFMPLASTPTEAFPVRARAIEAMGQQPGEDATLGLATLRAELEDPLLRHFAARELGRRREPGAVTALRAALGDPDPRVRETAVEALGQRRDRTAGGLLILAAKQEPWPFVRRAELRALSRICSTEAGDLFVRANERDVDEVRRAALLGLVACQDPRAPEILLRVLGRALEAPRLRALAAEQLGLLADPKTTRELRAILERLLNESQADLSLEGVVVALARALAAIGGPDAVAAAEQLLTDPRPLYRRAAVDTLGRLCAAPAAAAALQRITAAPDEDLALAARAALRSCGARRARP
jgi:HEAT repeat protein